MRETLTHEGLLQQGFRPLPLPAAATEVFLETNPFRPSERKVAELAADQVMTLAAIVAAAGVPDRFWREGVVEVTCDGRTRIMKRHYWAKGEVTHPIRLKATAERPVTIRLYLAPAGGGGKGKKILAIVATIALIAIGAWITGGGAAGLLPGLFAANSISAQVLAGAVSFLGRIAITMLLKPAARPTDENQAPELGQAGASGNTVEPGGIFYRVAGRRRLFPQMASLPLVELQGEDEIVEATYRCTGPHRLEELEIEETPASKINDLEWRMDEGTDPNPQRMIRRYGYQVTPQAELQAHRRSRVNFPQLENQSYPEESLPTPFTITSARDPDEIWLQLLWPGGMTESNSTPQCLMSVRLVMENVTTGESFNLPELMFASKYVGRISKMIVLTWAEAPSPIPYTFFWDGPFCSFHTVPAQNVAPAGGGAWAAHASFVNSGTATWNARRVKQEQDRFTVYLDPAVFARGHRWRVSITRSCITRYSGFAATGATFDVTTYGPTGNGNRYNLFGYFTAGPHYTANGSAFYTQATQETCVLMRFASVWNKSPNPEAGDAVIEVRGRNVNLTQASVIAAGLVPRFDGTGFTDVGVSENPADHIYDVLTGALTEQPVPQHLVDVPELAAWRQDCIDNNWRVSLVCDGSLWRETANAIAATGRARLKEGRLFGVVRQRDTAALNLMPTRVFSHLNMVNFAWNKPFGPLPDAIRVRFADRSNKWQPDYVEVKRPGVTDDAITRMINADAAGLDDRAQVIGHYSLYMAAGLWRDVVTSFDTWAEGIDMLEGQLIGINHLKVSQQHLAGRVIMVERNGGNLVTAVTIDTAPDDEEAADLEAVPDVAAITNLAQVDLDLGVTFVAGATLITQPVSSFTHWFEGPFAKARLVFAAPFAAPALKPSHQALIGRANATYGRFEVVSVRPGDNNMFNVTCVDEAPQMHSHIGAT